MNDNEKKNPNKLLIHFYFCKTKTILPLFQKALFFLLLKGLPGHQKGRKNGRGLECFFSKVFAFCE